MNKEGKWDLEEVLNWAIDAHPSNILLPKRLTVFNNCECDHKYFGVMKMSKRK